MNEISRTTIMAHPVITDRVSKHVEKTGDKLVDFYIRAIINQLEKEGDWQIRDEMEELTNAHKDN